MMTKARIPILGLVLLLAVTGAWNCSKNDNPFKPDILAGNGATGDLPTYTGGAPAQVDVADPVVIPFTEPMNRAMLESPDNVTVLALSDTTFVRAMGPGAVTALSLEYLPQTGQLSVRPATGDWPDDSGFLLKILGTVTNVSGLMLDGNRNNKAEGSPVDDVRIRFYTGAFLGPGYSEYIAVRTQPPRISSTDPDYTGTLNDILFDPSPTFTVNFANGPMDDATLTTDNFHLMVTATGEELELERTAVTDNSVSFQRAGSAALTSSTRYTFRVDPNVIKARPDITGDADSPLLVLDLDNDHIPETSEDPFQFDFQTVDGTGTPVDPPVVDDFGFHYPYSIEIRFTEEMDITTFTHQNITIFRPTVLDGGDGGGPPTGTPLTGTIIPMSDGMGFRFTMENAVGGTEYVLFISRQVRDAGGLFLDSNENGVGGEYGDDYARPFYWEI